MFAAATLLIAGGSLVITVPESATVRGSEVELTEVVEISGPANLVALAEEVSLGWAPAPGYSRTLQQGQIERRLRSALGEVDLTFAGFTSCQLQPEVELISAATLEAAARGLILERAGNRELEAVLRSDLEPVAVPVAESSFEILPRLSRALVGSGPLQVPVELRVDGLPWRTIWTQWEISLFEQQLVLTRDIRRGEVLTADALRVERVRVSAQGGIAITDRNLLVGARALRDLRSGVALSKVDVDLPMAVEKGATVIVEVRKNSIQARSHGTALEAGRIGEHVLVSVGAGSRTVRAKVVSKNHLQLVLN